MAIGRLLISFRLRWSEKWSEKWSERWSEKLRLKMYQKLSLYAVLDAINHCFRIFAPEDVFVTVFQPDKETVGGFSVKGIVFADVSLPV